MTYQQPQPYPHNAPAAVGHGRRSRRRPVGIALIVFGLVLFVAALAVAVITFPRPGGFPRTSGPTSTVDLTAGSWTVFAEGPGGSPISITAPDGTTVDVSPRSFSSSEYSIGSRSGVSVGTIDAPVDGSYTVTVAAGDTFAFAQNFGRDLAVAIVSGLLGVFGALAFIALGIILVILGRNR